MAGHETENGRGGPEPEGGAAPGGGRALVGVVFGVGFAAAGAQVVLLREVLVACGGNELIAGLALTCWMLGTAAGSALASLLLGTGVGRGRARWICGLALATLSAAVPLSLPLLILARGAAGPPAGELVALHQALAVSLAAFVPPGLAVGATFPAFCELLADPRGRGGRAAARVVWIEALGFAVAGLLFGLLLVSVVRAGPALILLGALVAASSLGLGRRARWATAVSAALLVVAALVALRVGEPSVFGDRVRSRTDSVHGRIEVLGEDGQRDVMLGGLWGFSFPDPESAERAVHPALLHHPAPGRILLVGGVVSGALAEVLKHPTVTHVDAVELDRALIEVARSQLPAEATAPLQDPRVALHLTDGRAFVRKAEGAYDVVILVVPDPRNARSNRYYTVEFFEQIEARLAPGGLVALGVTGSDRMLGPAQARYVASVRRTLAEVFPDVRALPGGTIGLLGARESGTLPRDTATLADRLIERGIDTHHVAPAALRFELGSLPVDYLEQVLREAEDTPLNRDLVPRCYFLDATLWATARSPRWRAAMTAIEGLRPGWLAAILIAGALLHAGAIRVRRLAGAARIGAVSAAVAVVGATGIVVELALILGYQVAFGNLYARIGLIVAAYMVGLAVGARAVVRRADSRSRAILLGAQVALAGACALLWLAASHLPIAGLPAAMEPLFPLAVAGVGLAAGLHLPAAVATRGAATGRGAGVLYAVDLGAAAAASLAASAVLIPVLGLPAILGLLTVGNVAAVGVLLAAKAR